MTTIHVMGSVKSPEQTDGLAKTRRVKMDAPGGHYQLFAFGPKAADVDLTAHFSFHASDSKKTDFDRSLKFGIVDPADKGAEQCEVALFSGGRVEIQGSGPTVGIVEHPTPSWRKDGNIRIIVLGPDVEVFVDGKRAYYGTIRKDASKRAVGFLIQAVGIDADVREVSWKKIETKIGEAGEK